MAYKKLNVKNPVLEKGVHYQTSPFGEREFPKGVITKHNGIDMIGKGYASDWIVSIGDGKVVEDTYSNSRGYYVGVKMANGYICRYLHMKEGSIQVKLGEEVKKGQRIGYMGNTGFYKDAAGKQHRVSTHLHFAVVNTKGNFVDPLPYLEGTKTFDKEPKKIKFQVSLISSNTYLPLVEVGDGYAGKIGTPIDCVKIEQLTYRVQAIGKASYYSWITGCSDKGVNGYAGSQGKRIKKLQIQGNHTYRVHIITDEKTGKGKWLGWITGYNNKNINGYAGWKNYPIDAIEIK